MKKLIKRFILYSLATVLVSFSLLLVILLNPALSYAHKASFHNHTVFYSSKSDPGFIERLAAAEYAVQRSELYKPALSLDICLNDGAWYPSLVKKIGGPAFARGFYNKVVILSSVNAAENTALLNGRSWNLTELIAHEMVHCHQYNSLGLLKSKPFANIPDWKWEGYPEYIARTRLSNKELAEEIKNLQKHNMENPLAWIELKDGTGTILSYYQAWLEVSYCISVRKISYAQLLKAGFTEPDIRKEMTAWAAAIF